MTALPTEAFEESSKLPPERQDELAQMLMDGAESDRLLSAGVHQLTPEQRAEVDAAIADDEYAIKDEVVALFARLRS